MPDKLYFAYGANTNAAGMAARCPAAQPLGPAWLDDHRLIFRSVADIAPREGEAVPGVLWWITPECEAALDVFEGFPRLYTKKSVTVERPDGVVAPAMVYVMNGGRISPPWAGYADTIREGYETFGLDTATLDDAIRRAERRAAKHRAAYPRRA